MFYLHADFDSTGISADTVVLLRVTVSLRAREHYEIMQKSRRGRLSGEFRNKVGWLAGNLYSRVGTPDWSDQEDGLKRFESLIEGFLGSGKYEWVKESLVKSAENEGVELKHLSSRDEVLRVLNECKPEPIKETIVKLVSSELVELFENMPQAIAGPISKKLENEFKQHDVSISAGQIQTTLLEHLSGLKQGVIDYVALSTAKHLIQSSSIKDDTLDILETKCREELEKSIENCVKALPEILSNRLRNKPLMGSVVDKKIYYSVVY